MSSEAATMPCLVQAFGGVPPQLRMNRSSGDGKPGEMSSVTVGNATPPNSCEPLETKVPCVVAISACCMVRLAIMTCELPMPWMVGTLLGTTSVVAALLVPDMTRQPSPSSATVPVVDESGVRQPLPCGAILLTSIAPFSPC